MSIQCECLKEFIYFSKLKQKELEDIARFFKEEDIEKGKLFIVEGGSNDYLYLLYAGSVKIYKVNPLGKELIISIPHRCHTLNAATIFGHSPNIANIETLSPVTVYKIHKEDILFLIKKYPQLAISILSDLAGLAYRAWSLAEDISFNQVIHRLAKILLKIFEAEQAWPRLTQYDIASMIGTSRKAVNRALKEMEEENAIRVDRKGITIIDKNQLEKLIHLTP
jgi:CRP-like cAMP-binding protein